MTDIGLRTFDRCTSLKSVTIPAGVTRIRSFTFRDCISLTSVTIGDGVASIGTYAFNDCSGLTSMTIPDGVTSIGQGAFQFCRNLADVYFDGDEPANVGIVAFLGVHSGCKAWVYIDKPGWSSYSEGDTWNYLTIAFRVPGAGIVKYRTESSGDT